MLVSYTDRVCIPAPQSGYSRAIEGTIALLYARTGDSEGEGATRKGPWQSVLHSPFSKGRLFWEERVC